MDADHEAHLSRILSAVTIELRSKYLRGQQEHCGRLWLKPEILEKAIEEALDLVVYLYTLREQQEPSPPSSPVCL